MIVKCKCTTKINFKESFKIGKQFYCRSCAISFVKTLRNKAWNYRTEGLIEKMSRLEVPIFYERKMPTLK